MNNCLTCGKPLPSDMADFCSAECIAKQIDAINGLNRVLNPTLIKFEITVKLDPIEGSYDNARDFEKLIRRTIPEWYLIDVKQI